MEHITIELRFLISGFDTYLCIFEVLSVQDTVKLHGEYTEFVQITKKRNNELCLIEKG